MKHLGTLSEYAIQGTLGTGSIGKVKLARSLKTGKQVAIKIISRESIANQPFMGKQIQREIALMRLMDHPNILGIYQVLESMDNIYLVEQYAQNGSLYDYIASIRVDMALHYFRQIIYGLEYLHAHGIAHRDLKPENILIDYANQVLIADFGLACWMPNNVADTSCGSPHYIAPEVISGSPYDGRAADIWSSGVILYAMLAHMLPFDDTNERLLCQKIRKGKYVLPPVIPVLQDLISKILVVDPLQRLSIDQIKCHPAFGLNLPNEYAIPAPIPLPKLEYPIFPGAEHDGAMKLLAEIGFDEIDELRSLLASSSPNIAKVFFTMLTEQIRLDDIPWGRSHGNEITQITEHPFVSPFDYATSGRDPFKITESSSHSFHNPPTTNSVWYPYSSQQPIYEQERTIRRVDMSMPSLMLCLQTFLTNYRFMWFHPSDRELIAKDANSSVYLTLIGCYDEDHTLSIDVRMSRGTQLEFDSLFKEIFRIFKDSIRKRADTPLSDANIMNSKALGAFSEIPYESLNNDEAIWGLTDM